MTLLHIRLLVQFAWWSTADLMECVSILSGHRTVFGRDSMSYQIMMPFTAQCQPSGPSESSNDLKQDLLGDHDHDDNFDGVDIDRNTLKGIDSHVRQQNVGKLQVIRSPEGEMAVIEKLRVDSEPKEKYEICHEFLSGQNEEHRLLKAQHKMQRGGGCDDRQIYNEKIADSVISEKTEGIDTENDKMFVVDPLRDRNESRWINECYYCELIK